jgi:integrase
MARRHNGEGSIYPYRNGFAAHVWITTPEGRRQRKSVYGKTREEVHAKWLKLHDQARRGPVVPRSPALATYLDGWLNDVVRPGLAPATVANYDLFVRLYIVPDLGRRKLEKLTVRDVQVWVNQLRTRCQCCAQGKDAEREDPRCCAAGKCCQQLASEWTVHQAWTVLRSALSAAMREELVTRNVAALVRVPVPRGRKSPVWSVDEARRFLESARADDDPLYAGYVLMLVLGLRRGELLGLAWEDVDLERHEAAIRWQVQRIKGELLRRPTKTKTSEAPLPLPDICVQALDQRRVTEARWRLAAGEAWAGSGLLLTTRLGDPLDPRNFHRYFKARAEKAGVPVISVHSTRRTCASLLVALDVHPRVAMAILRHSQIAVTMDIYSQVSSASTREALKRLGSQLGEGSL